MESVVVAVASNHDDEFRKRIADDLRFAAAQDGWVVEDADRRVYLSRNDSAAQELDSERLARIRQIVGEPVFYTVDYLDAALCREVLKYLADDPHLAIDNDHGLTLPGPQFVWRLRTDTNWDWREEG